MLPPAPSRVEPPLAFVKLGLRCCGPTYDGHDGPWTRPAGADQDGWIGVTFLPTLSFSHVHVLVVSG